MASKKETFGAFHVKEGAAKSTVVIEGFANKAVRDRIGEVIPPEAWELDNFMKNPIIFFNHDRDFPIGKAVDVKVTDEGLKIKAQISRSKDPAIARIRDLISEGILSTFSVGFDDHDSAERESDGSITFKRAELLENSVVTIPMNQESTFSVVNSKAHGGRQGYKLRRSAPMSTKNMRDKDYESLKEEVLNEKGAWLAAATHNAIYNLQKDGISRDSIIADLMEKTGLGRGELDSIMAGNKTPAPAAFIKGASEVLNVDEEMLERVNKGDVELESDAEEAEETEAETQGADEADENGDGEKQKSEDGSDAHKDFQECVSAKIPKLIEEGKERDEAIAAAINLCKDEKGCQVELTKSDYEMFIKQADGEDEEEEKEEEKPEDEEEESKEKQAVVESSANESEEFNIGQPGVELQKAQLALSGQISQTMSALLVEMQKQTGLLESALGKGEPQEDESDEEAEKVEDSEEEDKPEAEEEKAEESEEEESEEEEKEEEEDEEPMDEEEKAAMARVKKNLEQIELYAKKLESLY